MFEVQQYTFCEGWVNTWIIEENGIEKPEQFNTYEEAKKELTEFFQEIKEQIEDGERDLDNGYDPEEFRIVEIKEG